MNTQMQQMRRKIFFDHIKHMLSIKVSYPNALKTACVFPLPFNDDRRTEQAQRIQLWCARVASTTVIVDKQRKKERMVANV